MRDCLCVILMMGTDFGSHRSKFFTRLYTKSSTEHVKDTAKPLTNTLKVSQELSNTATDAYKVPPTTNHCAFLTAMNTNIPAMNGDAMATIIGTRMTRVRAARGNRHNAANQDSDRQFQEYSRLAAVEPSVAGVSVTVKHGMQESITTWNGIHKKFRTMPSQLSGLTSYKSREALMAAKEFVFRKIIARQRQTHGLHGADDV
jgi:hypothetical protein